MPLHLATPAPRRFSPPPRMRLGAVVKSLLTTICGAALLMTAAAVLDPNTLQAGSTSIARESASREAHDDFLRTLSSLIKRCEGVLAFRSANAERGAEIVLWLEDHHDAGQVNVDELALIRHNALFQTITVYAAAHDAGLPQRARRDRFSPMSAAMTAAMTAVIPADADVAAPGFIDRWRGLSAVQATVIATEISDMRLEPIEGVQTPGLSLLRVHLRWNEDSADGGDEASVIVEAGRRPDAVRTRRSSSRTPPQRSAAALQESFP